MCRGLSERGVFPQVLQRCHPVHAALNANVTNVLRLAAPASTLTPVDSGQTPVNGFMPQHTHAVTHTHTHTHIHAL